MRAGNLAVYLTCNYAWECPHMNKHVSHLHACRCKLAEDVLWCRFDHCIAHHVCHVTSCVWLPWKMQLTQRSSSLDNIFVSTKIWLIPCHLIWHWYTLQTVNLLIHMRDMRPYGFVHLECHNQSCFVCWSEHASWVLINIFSVFMHAWRFCSHLLQLSLACCSVTQQSLPIVAGASVGWIHTQWTACCPA